MIKPLRYLSISYSILRIQGLSALFKRIYRKILPFKKPSPPDKTHLATHYFPLNFVRVNDPEISIIIPAYNKHLYTFTCLESIYKHRNEAPGFEIIVVDDFSNDETTQMLNQLAGITVIRNSTHKGFIHSCNIGANAAKGNYLLFLNNDTVVTRGWLNALRNTFSDFPDAGLVGAKLIYPDGQLQEAGGIVWQDGSAWSYGRFDDPNKPEYSYCRAVDYCSGTCIVISKQDFFELGLMDVRYAPAYYADTDLAFRVRAANKQVYYQPNAVIVHFEGVSSGVDTTSGTKQYQVINHDKFYQQWKETLKSHRHNGELPELEKERNIHKRALIIDARVLMPDNDSGSLRMFNLLQIFQKLGYKTSFIANTIEYHDIYTRQMQAIGIECFYFPYLKSIHEHIKKFGHTYNVVLLSRADVAEKYIDTAKKFCPNAIILFDTVDLHFLREQRQADITKNKLSQVSARLRKQQELSIARKADKTIVVSPIEIEYLKAEAPDLSVELLSNIHKNQETVTHFHDRKDILFIGNFEHPPNLDAIEYFIHDIFPKLHQQKPDLKLIIIGSDPPEKLLSYASPFIIIKGFVPDIKPVFDHIKLSIAPLRYGAGVKGKINTSMTYGVPVVATPIAMEGMNLIPEQDILIADTPEDFTKQIIRAYDNESLWTSLSESGRINIEKNFSFSIAENQLQKILQRNENI